MIVRSKVIMRMMQFNVIHTKRRRSTDVFRVTRRLIECANLTLRPEEYFRYSFSWVGRCYIIPNLNNCIARTFGRDLLVLLDRTVICARNREIFAEDIQYPYRKFIQYPFCLRKINVLLLSLIYRIDWQTKMFVFSSYLCFFLWL